MWFILGLFFLGVCIGVAEESSGTHTKSSTRDDEKKDIEYYTGGDFRVRNWWDNGFTYSNNVTSYEDFFGVEYRSNNTLVTKDSWGMSHVYDRDSREEIAIEYTDSWGMRHRENKSRF